MYLALPSITVSRFTKDRITTCVLVQYITSFSDGTPYLNGQVNGKQFNAIYMFSEWYFREYRFNYMFVNAKFCKLFETSC